MVGAKMTASELADAMEIRASIRRKATSRKSVQENANDRLADQLEQAATMLRQQQTEIEALKKDNKELHAIAQRMAMAESDARKSLQWFKDAKEMNNEPVAWAVWEGSVHDMFFTKEDADELCRLKGGDAKSVPLYTHPVKEQLTAEEINQVAKDCKWDYDEINIIDFARAILLKAQEK